MSQTTQHNRNQPAKSSAEAPRKPAPQTHRFTDWAAI
ncbi:hypothetical protein TM5383_01917 [Thalassovita mediterranea]|uniref:Uncharacterized protein n=1 Tax=Thalassovita mediterranea TaxID=340021 RepID=A0A0P1GQ51_9RHOB|nr:hypothetical protein TM5383_01917 [Thalassovita mediterranea]SIS32411.1 hypothetical protein SAMN05421685_106162 [Thalassovita mediterranea]